QMRGQFLLRRLGVEAVDSDGTPRDGMAKLLCLLFSADGNLYFVRRKGVAIQAAIVALQGVGEFVPSFQSVAFERVEDDVGPEETLARLVETVVEPTVMLALPWPRQILREARRVSLVDLVPVGRPVRHVNRHCENGVGDRSEFQGSNREQVFHRSAFLARNARR